MGPQKKKRRAKTAKGKKSVDARAGKTADARLERGAEPSVGLESVTPAPGGEKAAPPPEQTASFNFSEFFQKVGQGLVEAQRKMDAESLAYLQEVSTQPHVLPSIFRIPQISADVKFALTKESDRDVGIIFYKDESKEQTLNQQSVQFNIVSVPAPLQLNAPLGVNLVFSTSERQGILEQIKTFQLPGVADTQGQLGLKAALANPDQILMYAVSPNGAFYLAYADNQKNENVGFWFVTLNPTMVFAIRKFGDAGGIGLQRLRDLVLLQGKTQAEFLNRTRV